MPAVEPARPARRTKRVSVQKPFEIAGAAGTFVRYSGRQDAALYVRRDA